MIQNRIRFTGMKQCGQIITYELIVILVHEIDQFVEQIMDILMVTTTNGMTDFFTKSTAGGGTRTTGGYTRNTLCTDRDFGQTGSRNNSGHVQINIR